MKLILFCLLFSTNASALYKEVIEYIQLNSITSKIEKKGLTQKEKNFINIELIYLIITIYLILHFLISKSLQLPKLN